MEMLRPVTTVFLTLVLFGAVRSWETFELEIFDVVEEVNRNFYEFMEITQDATSSDVKRAYRKLSLQLHPDKNDAPDASVQFRNLVAIYEILKDEKKRARYDQVLVEGLPNWRNPLYYYRRYRKMGTMETSLWLIILTSIIQYAVYVAAYWEKKFEIREVLGSKVKKQKKQSKKKANQTNEEDIDIIEEEIKQIPKPSVWDLLPFQFIRLCIWTAKTVPTLPGMYRDHLEQKRKILEKEEAEMREREEEEQRAKELEAERKQRRKKTYKLEERTGEDGTYTSQDGEDRNGSVPVREAPVITGGFWTDDDIAELARLMKKFPPGTLGRWEKIAEMMNRTVAEVTKVANREKNNLCRSGAKVENVNEEEEPAQEESEVVEVKKKVKTKGGKFAQEATTNTAAMDSSWSQKQQRALEAALGEYPKGCLERWEKIAKAVPGKTKEDCMLRVRYLAEVVRKKKEEEERKTAEIEAERSEESLESAIQ